MHVSPGNPCENAFATYSMRCRKPTAKWRITRGCNESGKQINGSRRSERYRYITYADGTEELYDHQSDLWEWQKLADNPEYAEVKQTMRQKLPTHHEPDGATYVPPNPNWGKQKSKSKK